MHARSIASLLVCSLSATAWSRPSLAAQDPTVAPPPSSAADGVDAEDIAPAIVDAPSITPPAHVEPALARGEIRLHLVGEGRNASELVLFRNAGGMVASSGTVTVFGSSWTPVCSAPCGTRLDGVSGSYFVNGANDGPALRSRNFTLGTYEGDVTVRVRTGSKAAYITGFMLLPAGLTMTAIGPMMLAFAKKYDHPERVPGAAAVIGVGVVATVVAVILIARGRNKARIERGAPRGTWRRGRAMARR